MTILVIFALILTAVWFPLYAALLRELTRPNGHEPHLNDSWGRFFLTNLRIAIYLGIGTVVSLSILYPQWIL